MGAEMHPFSLPAPPKPKSVFLRYRNGVKESDMKLTNR